MLTAGFASQQFRRIAVASALMLGLGLGLGSTPSMALEIYVDQNSSWRYINATAATTQAVDPNWFAYAYDDSGWFAGTGIFSSGGAGTFGGDLGNVDGPYDPGTAPALPATGASYTQWDVNADPYIRTSFFLDAPTDLTIWLAVDNGINSMYINGVQATASVNAEGAAFRWEHVFDIDASFTTAGLNVIAMQLEDHGGATAFTAVVSSNDEAGNPDFTSNPPPEFPVPAPAPLTLMGLGLAAMARLRRRR